MQTDKWITKRRWELCIVHLSDDAHLNIESLKEDVIKGYFDDASGSDSDDYEIDDVRIIDTNHSNVRWHVVPKFEINGELESELEGEVDDIHNFDESHWNCLTLNYNPTELQNRNMAILDLTQFIIKRQEEQEITSYNLISYETRLACDIKLKFAVKPTSFWKSRHHEEEF